ncbi:hypothetical protein [Sinomicrobium sp. M5D2P9]
MPIQVKYVVLTEDYANWIIENTKEHYKRLFKDHKKYPDIRKHLDETYTLEPLVKSHNDFSKQMLMAFEESIPVASAELIASLPGEEKPEDSDKPLLAHKILHNTEGKGLAELLQRLEEITRQKKHDALIIRTFKAEDTAQKIIRNAGFESFKTGDAQMGNASVEQVLFIKNMV